jgi:hypothetical protein
VEETTVEFNAKIVGTESTSRESTLGINTELGGKWGGGALSVLGGPQVEFKTSIAYQSKSSQGAKVERTYSLNVKVKAVQDQIPAGMERLLTILENSIREQVAPSSPGTKPTPSATGTGPASPTLAAHPVQPAPSAPPQQAPRTTATEATPASATPPSR